MAFILIVEDEPKLAKLEQDYLQQAGYDTHCLYNGLEVVPWVKNHPVDLILLDLMLPDKDGLSICQAIREFSNVPIIMVTAKVEEADRLLGLDIGADDYICKPFSPREVVARVKVILRRLQPDAPLHAIEFDETAYLVTLQGKSIELTAVEFQLFKILAQTVGKIHSRHHLMTAIYNDHRVVSDRTIDSHIKKLRKKIAQHLPNKDLIHSVYSLGYKFEWDD
jgi:two-component system response regulator BaeR